MSEVRLSHTLTAADLARLYPIQAHKDGTRQQRRHRERVETFAEVTERFGGEPRKNRRRMARNLAKNRRAA